MGEGRKQKEKGTRGPRAGGSMGSFFAPVKKSIYSLGALRELLGGGQRRYLEFLSAIDDPQVGLKRIEKISRPAKTADGRIGDSTSFMAMTWTSSAPSSEENTTSAAFRTQPSTRLAR